MIPFYTIKPNILISSKSSLKISKEIKLTNFKTHTFFKLLIVGLDRFTLVENFINPNLIQPILKKIIKNIYIYIYIYTYMLLS